MTHGTAALSIVVDAQPLALGSDFDFHHIDVAPLPVFSRLERLHDGMMRGVIMFRGVLVLRTVATAHVTARQAEPQMNPTIALFKAFFAAGCSRLHIPDLIDVLARAFHVRTPSELC
jgi:hypothetical protein